ncbi:Endonuclease/exonuclease/phosphatase [Cantharellus anzutake]|uniref:Endonuclease/exonuclease/phosphatase n=1 Tax=Cantharellus anzutake TaxID=1750568 RepID=UPI001907E056|nr:Endonuclease/exonuclease/phosphatase [Cantharellus anzutake]KAF8327397.1 Endonuclease/exonuclease/phosphatase [Cantharellus anzutake]
MRILSWNINGIRTLPHYHPWNALKTCEAILPELHSDIICFQEMKISRKDLDRKTAVPEGYDSFFSFPQHRGGYSGVAVYYNPDSAIAAKAEEGLSLHIQPRPPYAPAELISKSYPSVSELPLFESEQGNTPSDLIALDTEGRALVLDFGLFVLINVYCPNDASDERLVFKINYLLMLESRVHALIEEGRNVIVVGDINVAATPFDHCEGGLESKKQEWYDNPAREWFRKWLAPIGPMHDVIREAWPDRVGMYTCWNTKIQARETNYGTRIDYILMTSNLLPWIKGADIQATIRGSDHCPIYVDLHDEISLPSGERRVLLNELGARGRDPPNTTSRLAAKFWDEWSGKQTLLSSFFGKESSVLPEPPLRRTLSASGGGITFFEGEEGKSTGFVEGPETFITNIPTMNTDPFSTLPSGDDAQTAGAGGFRSQSQRGSARTTNARKRGSTDLVSSTSGPRAKKPRSGQASISSYFSKPRGLARASDRPSIPGYKSQGWGERSESHEESQDVNSRVTYRVASDDEILLQPESVSVALGSMPDESESHPQIESDCAYTLLLSQGSESALSGSSSPRFNDNGIVAWRQLMAPIEPPCCTVHNEPAKLLRVNKPGPNKDRQFYICSRPVGPGYDAGKMQRLREEVNPRYRCDFFKWASDARRQQKKHQK